MSMSKFPGRILLVLFPLLSGMAAAHEYWIAPGEFRPGPGTALSPTVCQGHDFPECENFEFPATFSGLTVSGEGVSERLELKADASGAGVTHWQVPAAGRYAFTMQLIMTRRGREIPMYTARTEIFVPGKSGEAPPAGPDKGLVIQLREAPKAGSDVVLRVLSDGRPAEVGLEIKPEKGRSYAVNTDSSGEVSLRKLAVGRYLVYGSHQGVSGSLSFELPPN
jgi:hypothetical protein